MKKFTVIVLLLLILGYLTLAKSGYVPNPFQQAENEAYSANGLSDNIITDINDELDQTIYTEVAISSGEILINPTGECLAPLSITAKEGYSYYVYLQSLTDSINDVAFYMEGNTPVSISMPLGDYKLYYAVGKTWYGMDNKFGNNTQYYTSDDTLTFSSVEENGYTQYLGYTIELIMQVNGNLSTREISASNFPE